jgi:hypothetical protein
MKKVNLSIIKGKLTKEQMKSVMAGSLCGGGCTQGVCSGGCGCVNGTCK